MMKPQGRIQITLIAITVAALAATAVVWWRTKSSNPTAVKPMARLAATIPATTDPATTRQANPGRSCGDYLDVVRRHYTDFPATQPLGVPLELSQAAHLILTDPIHLGGIPRSEMWITRPDAPPTEQVLKDAIDDAKDIDVHVTRERVAFVHWMPTDHRNWPPYLICERGSGRYDVVSAEHGRQSLPTDRGYYWEHAFSWNESIVVPTNHGVAILRLTPTVVESYHPLAASIQKSERNIEFSEPRVLLDGSGLIAWMPWESGKIGGRGAARYVPAAGASSATGSWMNLDPEKGWPEKILHLVPLRDGTVLILNVADSGAVGVAFNTLDTVQVDEKAIAKLVAGLSDDDDKVRNDSYAQLLQYGSGIWPILEKMFNDQGPEAQARMKLLLRERVTPTLNGMSLLGDKALKLVARLSDGGTIFYAEAGISRPDPEHPDAEPEYRVPAWISIRPGEDIRLLPQTLTADLSPDKAKFFAHDHELIVTTDAHGPRRFVGNGFVTLLRKSETAFGEFVGADRRGRWLFRKPDQLRATTGPSTASSTNTMETLIIDPTLPDPTPRLPVWVFGPSDVAGWTKADWPVAKKASAYALHENGWELVDEKETIYSQPRDVPPPVEPPAIVSATAPSTTGPTTLPVVLAPTTVTSAPATTQSGERPLLTDRDGNQYFGGLTDLRIINRSGRQITWPLPPLANGDGPAWLIRAADGRLFLFNQPGRVLRIKPMPVNDASQPAAEPFKLEKIFTHRVPTVERPTRIWLDPAGRIIMAWEGQLAIFFPAGYIPPAIADLMMFNANDEGEE